MSNWTIDKAETLRRRWSEGASASTIAAEIGTQSHPVTRNAVIGAVYRMGLQKRLANPKPGPKPKRSLESRLLRRVQKPRPSPVRAAETAPAADFPPPEPVEIDVPDCGIVTHGVGIAELKHDSCRWIDGSPSDAIYCGAEAEPQRSYCAAHVRLAYIARRAS
jgi:GcrA cell cycle regulator